MTPEARKWLDDLDEMLANGSTATTRDIMAVLTALRGPDNDHHEVKKMATIPIRRAAFPKTAISDWGPPSVGEGRVMSMGYETSETNVTLFDHEYNDHFNTHARMAAEVLGLNVNLTQNYKG